MRKRRPLPVFPIPVMTLAALAVLVLLVPLDVAQAQEADPRRDGAGNTYYGINFIPPEEPWLSLASETGAGVVRWQFNWRDHEPQPGLWQWEQADRFIEAWLDAGIAVHALLHNPPDWAKENPGSGLMPTNRDLPWDHPDNGWGRYCYEFANRYRGMIHSYEIWNEPDLDQYWEGTAQQYFHIMRSCYTAIKAADPDATVAMAGMALLIEPQFFPEVVRLAAEDPNGAANNFYFDAANIHMYSYPLLVYQLTEQTRVVLDRYGMGSKPIWITETNLAVRGYGVHPDRPNWAAGTPDEVGWFMLQSIGFAKAAGVEKFMVFRFADADMDQAFGLLTNSGARRPSFFAMQWAAANLTDIISAERISEDDVETIVMERADGTRLLMVFTQSGKASTATVPASQRAGVLMDQNGQRQRVEANADNEYVISLPPAPNRDFNRPQDYTVGSPPVFIVEGDVTPPTATIEAEPLEGSRTDFFLQWGGDDGDLGTGVETYDVEYSPDEGNTWLTFMANTTQTEAAFDAIEAGGDGYFLFRVRAVDYVKNIGAYSEPIEVGLKPVGYLTASAVDLRGQEVPVTRVALGDGTLHDSGGDGIVEIELPLGRTRIVSIDGSAHGIFYPDEVINVELAELYERIWLLQPRVNLVRNHTFNEGTGHWAVNGGEVVFTSGENVLRLDGKRRPWGTPYAATSFDLPSGASGVVSFFYRMPEGQSTFKIRAITPNGDTIVWQAEEHSENFIRAWADLSALAGQRVTLRFELWAPKGVQAAPVEFDQVIVGDIPILED